MGKMTPSDLPIVAAWLARHALLPTHDEGAATQHLFRQMLNSPKAEEAAAAGGVIPVNQDFEVVSHWLAVQILSAGEKSAGFKSAKACLISLLMDGTIAEQASARCAIVWMTLHTRPARCLSRSQRQSLIADPSKDGTNWATLALDRNVIRPMLKGERWWQRCRFAHAKFGFDFADEAVNFVWERIERYRPSRGDFRAWGTTVLNNYWRTLHRNWRRSIPKDSEIAKELDRFANEDGRRRFRLAPEMVDSRPPPFAPVDSIAAAPTDPVFSDADFAVLNRWNPLDRVLFGLETGLWRQLPRHVWNDWLKRGGINGWASDAPMGALTPAECRRVVARMTNIKVAALTKRWQRLRPAISKLPSVNRLMAYNAPESHFWLL
jgi:hypothetical protein